MIRFYQAIKRVVPIPPTCRFVPTCSCYAQKAIEQHGAWFGTWLAIKRVSRCHPFHAGGFDPIP